jgi:mRNA interferase MazF
MPGRGEVWLADLDPTREHEQAGKRPVLVFSVDLFNSGPSNLVIVIPITSHLRPVSSHIRIKPPEGGLRVESAALCEAIRSISKKRLIRCWGSVHPQTMYQIEQATRILLGL